MVSIYLERPTERGEIVNWLRDRIAINEPYEFNAFPVSCETARAIVALLEGYVGRNES